MENKAIRKLVVSATEAASMIGETPSNVCRYCEEGELGAYRNGRIWKIPIAILEQYVVDKAIAAAKVRSDR